MKLNNNQALFLSYLGQVTSGNKDSKESGFNILETVFSIDIRNEYNEFFNNKKPRSLVDFYKYIVKFYFKDIK